MTSLAGEGAEGGGGPIVRDQWLKDHKLMDAAKVFEERDIDVEELVEFEEEELVDFGRELGLDTLARKRFVKAVMALKKRATTGSRPPIASTLGTAVRGESALSSPLSTFSAEPSAAGGRDHALVSKLLRRFELSKALVTKLDSALPQLASTGDECAARLKTEVASIVAALGTRKSQLSLEMNELKEVKRGKLQKQLTQLKAYKEAVARSKHDYEQLIADVSLSAADRRRRVDELMDALLTQRPPLVLVTRAKVQFAFDKQAFDDYLASISVDDCDVPKAPSGVAVVGSVMTVRMTPALVAAKALRAFAVEFALVKKLKSKESTTKKKKKKKRRKYSTDSDDSSDSESDSSSSEDSSDESKSDDSQDSDDSDSDSESDSDSSGDSEESDSDDEKKDSDDSSDDSSARGSKKATKKKKSKKALKKEKKKMLKSYEVQNSRELLTVLKAEFCVIPEGLGAKKKKKRKGVDGDVVAALSVETAEPSQIEEVTVEWTLLKIEMSSSLEFSTALQSLKASAQYALRVRALNASGWGHYSPPLVHLTAAIAIDSKLMGAKEIRLLLKYVPKKWGKKSWKLVFRASKHGFGGSDFHRKVDGKRGATVVVIKSMAGNVFGAFTSVPWTSSGAYAQDPKAFLFLLKSKVGPRPGKFKVTNVSNTVFHNASYGPTFGSGHDLYLCNNCNTVNQSYCQPGSSFAMPKGSNTYIAGAYNFTVKDYEVFLLK